MSLTQKQQGETTAGYDLSSFQAVVVLYNMTPSACESLQSINKSAEALGQHLDVLLYDNSREPQNDLTFKEFSNLNCTYLHDPSNPGVSKAYNYAGDLAAGQGKSFLLLLDQDTHFPGHSLQKYLEAVNTHRHHYLFCPILSTPNGIYSPTKYYFRRGSMWHDVQPGVHSLKNRNVLNSGMLVSLAQFLEVGGYNEKIELYFSDFDFVNRFHQQHEEMVVVDLICTHSISDIDLPDIQSALRRFRHYVTGSYYSALNRVDYSYLFITVFLRAVKLSFRYRNKQFIQLFFKRYLVARNN